MYAHVCTCGTDPIAHHTFCVVSPAHTPVAPSPAIGTPQIVLSPAIGALQTVLSPEEYASQVFGSLEMPLFRNQVSGVIMCIDHRWEEQNANDHVMELMDPRDPVYIVDGCGESVAERVLRFINHVLSLVPSGVHPSDVVECVAWLAAGLATTGCGSFSGLEWFTAMRSFYVAWDYLSGKGTHPRLKNNCFVKQWMYALKVARGCTRGDGFHWVNRARVAHVDLRENNGVYWDGTVLAHCPRRLVRTMGSCVAVAPHPNDQDYVSLRAVDALTGRVGFAVVKATFLDELIPVVDYEERFAAIHAYPNITGLERWHLCEKLVYRMVHRCIDTGTFWLQKYHPSTPNSWSAYWLRPDMGLGEVIRTVVRIACIPTSVKQTANDPRDDAAAGLKV